nr:hypothetical protein [Micromonospora sp. Rc5]
MISHQLPQPGDGPAADRPRAYPPHATPHTPLRPLWCCRACGQPWPCAEARLLLKADYAGNAIGLSIYLCGMFYEAARTCAMLAAWSATVELISPEAT